jgi:hypothetical protein
VLFNEFFIDAKGRRLALRFAAEDEWINSGKLFTQDFFSDGIEALEDDILWAIAGRLVSDLKEKYSEFRIQYAAIIIEDWAASIQTRHCRRPEGGISNYESI